MWTASRFPVALSLLLLATPARAQSTSEQRLAASEATLHYRDQEAALLHRRIDLSGVQQWQSKTQTLVPLALPSQRLFFINLWSLRCRPCMDEFPRLRNIAQEAKKRHLDIKFLFIADPPEETIESDLQKFWTAQPIPLPTDDPYRSTDTRLRTSVGVDGVPISLLVDRDMIVRHAFVGSIEGRSVAAAIERLLEVLPAAARPQSKRAHR